MANMGTADFTHSLGTQPIIFTLPQAAAPKQPRLDYARLAAEARAKAENAVPGGGWVFRSLTDIRAGSAVYTMRPQYGVTTFAADDHVVTIVDIFSKGADTAFTLTTSLAGNVTSMAFLANASAGDDMQSAAPIVDLESGTPVCVTAAPIGVTLARPTGVVIGPSEWEGYYVIHLDAPALYHHPDGTDESFDELVEAFDNFTVLTPKH